MIAISLSPNTQTDDILQAFKVLLKPWTWKTGEKVLEVEEWFKNYLDTSTAVSFNSGRSAMYSLLKSFGIGDGDEVIIQAFTCLALPEVIKWLSAVPKYVDIDETLNIDFKLLEKSISPKTKAIIVQHTFGIPAKMDLITKITQKYNLILIEDCAHAIGSSYQGKKIGTFGDAAFFSFGRDKVISSVFGGMAVINEKSLSIKGSHYQQGKIKNAKMTLLEFRKTLSYPTNYWIFQQLFHPLAFALILPLYQIGLGKMLLVFLQKLNLLSFPISEEEKRGQKPEIFPSLYPNALALLLSNQLKKLDRLNLHRKEIAKNYFTKLSKRKNILLPPKIDGAIYLRFNILVKNAKILREAAQKKGMLLGNWYHNIIDPQGSLGVSGYPIGSCKKAEEISVKSLNLPTNISVKLDDVDKIVSLI